MIYKMLYVYVVKDIDDLVFKFLKNKILIYIFEVSYFKNHSLAKELVHCNELFFNQLDTGYRSCLHNCRGKHSRFKPGATGSILSGCTLCQGSVAVGGT